MKTKKSESERADTEVPSVPILEQGIGTRIREAVDKIGSREHAAKVAHASTESLRRWINGSAGPPFLAVASIAREAGFSLDWIAFGDGPRGRDGVREDMESYQANSRRLEADLVRNVVEFVEHRLDLPSLARCKVTATLRLSRCTRLILRVANRAIGRVSSKPCDR